MSPASNSIAEPVTGLRQSSKKQSHSPSSSAPASTISIVRPVSVVFARMRPSAFATE